MIDLTPYNEYIKYAIYIGFGIFVIAYFYKNREKIEKNLG